MNPAAMPAPALRWPRGERLAVSFVVNVEEGSERSTVRGDKGMESVDEFGMFVKDAIRNHANESNYQFGIRVGAGRVLRLLAAHRVPATWTVCGLSLEQAPELARALTAAGHEAASHGWRWQFQYRMDEAQEREFIRKAVASIEQTTGQRPLGWLSRYLPSDHTRRLLAEEGFLYHMDDFSDERPFWDAPAGRPIVVLPYQLDTNDMKMWADGGYSARDWLDYVVDSFDLLYAEGGDGDAGAGLLSVGLHLRIIGRPGRAQALGRLLAYIAGKPDVWLATRAQIARHFVAACPYAGTL
jgi:peptidoglycan/xylan/chitin deacetylase (PgdA/CDA1 family)